MTVSALTFSLDSQIAWGAAGKAVLGDPAERQRLYAARLKALHVVVKTGSEGGTDPVALAQNAWAYPTHSRSRYTFVLDAYRLGARLCQAHHVDVISSQDPFATGLVAYLLSRRFGKPLNVQVHFDVLDNPYWVGERSEHRLLNAIGKWLIRRADTVRAGTSREAERFASWGIPAERIFVAPVPVDLGQFRQPPSGSQDSETSIHRSTVLNASRLVPQKDLQTLLRAARKVTAYRPDVQFVIAGDGPQRERLEAQVEDLGLGGNVRLLGRVDHKEMPRLLASADLLAVSSVYEGTSLVTVQAAAAGKPVVTTNVAGATDTVKDGETGRVVPIGDVDALANAILEVLSDSNRAYRMGAAGQAHVCERFERDKCVEQVVEMWRRTAELGAKQTRHSSPFTDHSPRWLYLANVRVPSEKAHVYQIFQMLDVFRAAGVEVTLAYPRRANLPGIADIDPAEMYGLRARPTLQELRSIDPVRLVTIDVPTLNCPPWPQLAFGLQSASFAISAALHTRTSRPDVLYSRDWPVLMAAVFAAPSTPAFWEAHDLPQAGVAKRALQLLLPRLKGIVAISRGIEQDLVRLGVSPKRILVAPDAVDLARFSTDLDRDQARAKLQIDSSARLVVYTGHLYRWKGAHTLALASRRLAEDALVYIVGGTPADLRNFRSFVTAEQLNWVRVVGHVPPADVPSWLAAADVLVLPNSAKEAISARYTSPLKLYEYMASVRPIVASRLPSLEEVLRHGENAWLVSPDDPAALADGVRHLLKAPDLARALAKQAYLDVQGKTWDARAKRIAAFVGEMLAPSEGSR